MLIHYFIILHGFIVVFSSVNKGSTLIFIINHVQSRQKLAFNSNLHMHARLYYRRNRTTDLMETSLVNNRSPYKSNGTSTNGNRITNILRKIKNGNHTRVRRDFLRENTINDEDNVNIYDDGKYFRNDQEEIAEQKGDYDEEYYLPSQKKLKMRNNNELYGDHLDQLNRVRNKEERNAIKRYMQNDESLINPNRLANDYPRRYFPINPNRKNLADYYQILKNQLNRYGKTYLHHDYSDKEDEI